MVFHSDDQHGAALQINSTVPVLARRVDFVNNFLRLADFVRLVALVPLHPVVPHFEYLLLLELSGDAESSHCVDVRVELSTMLEMPVILIELFDD